VGVRGLLIFYFLAGSGKGTSFLFLSFVFLFLLLSFLPSPGPTELFLSLSFPFPFFFLFFPPPLSPSFSLPCTISHQLWPNRLFHAVGGGGGREYGRHSPRQWAASRASMPGVEPRYTAATIGRGLVASRTTIRSRRTACSSRTSLGPLISHTSVSALLLSSIVEGRPNCESNGRGRAAARIAYDVHNLTFC